MILETTAMTISFQGGNKHHAQITLQYKVSCWSQANHPSWRHIANSLHGKEHDDLVTRIRHRTRALNGAAVCVMLCLIGSPPRTVPSVITYLIPASTSNSTGSKTCSTT
jgi:hypothetical protein